MGKVGQFFEACNLFFFCFVLFIFHLLVMQVLLPAHKFQNQTKDLDTKKHLLDFSLWLFLIVVFAQ